MLNNSNLIVFLASVLLFNFTLRASELVAGRWEGFVEMHKQGKNNSTFIVKQSKTGEYLVKVYYEETLLEFESLQITENALTFDLDTGTKYNCQLFWDINSFYDGECTKTLNNETRTIKMRMNSPAPAPAPAPVEIKPESPPVNKEQVINDPESPPMNQEQTIDDPVSTQVSEEKVIDAPEPL